MKVGRKPSDALKFAREMGVTKRQVHIAGGYKRLLSMSPEARAFTVGQMKKANRGSEESRRILLGVSR